MARDTSNEWRLRAPWILRAALVASLTLLATPSARADDVQVLLDKAEALATVFPDADHVVEIRHILSPSEATAISGLARRELDEGGFYLYRATRDGQVSGYATVVSQVGKVRPITHIVGVTPDGRVGRVAVMIYRESHGGEVAADRFLDQYRGLSLSDSILIDADVVNIAGATLSGNAICRGVRKALAAVEVLFLRADDDFLGALLATGTDVTPPVLLGEGGDADGEVVRWDAGGEALRVERRIMGTICAVELRTGGDGHPGGDVLLAAARAALDEVERWDNVLSDWRDDTPLARLNAAPEGMPFPSGSDLLAWLDHAGWMAQVTDGAFDPAVGALVDVWGLRGKTPARPTTAALDMALGSTGVSLFSADPEAGTVTRRDSDARLDPGASGKGWALDMAAEVLRQRGVDRALLSFRSTLLAMGPPPGEEAWTVPVVHDGSGRVVARVALLDRALSVSGGSLRPFDDGGRELGHVIDPRDGEPVPAARLAWVTHPSAATADALSTALLVEGLTLSLVLDAEGSVLTDADASPEAWPVGR
jgi:thiamine biosynthesis lipoprotein ApbE/Na+-translocating ferredoxin:NAD+ oxidoreductase RnfG subunit